MMTLITASSRSSEQCSLRVPLYFWRLVLSVHSLNSWQIKPTVVCHRLCRYRLASLGGYLRELLARDWTAAKSVVRVVRTNGCAWPSPTDTINTYRRRVQSTRDEHRLLARRQLLVLRWRPMNRPTSCLHRSSPERHIAAACECHTSYTHILCSSTLQMRRRRTGSDRVRGFDPWLDLNRRGCWTFRNSWAFSRHRLVVEVLQEHEAS